MPLSKTHVTSSTENLPEGGFQESQLPFSSHWPVDCRQRSEHCVRARHTRTITQQNKHCNPQFKSSTVGSKATRCQPQHHWTNGPLQIPSITLDGTWTEKEPPLFKSPFLVKLLWKSVDTDSVDTASAIHTVSKPVTTHAYLGLRPSNSDQPCCLCVFWNRSVLLGPGKDFPEDELNDALHALSVFCLHVLYV